MPCKWMKVKQGVGEKSYSFKVDHYPCLISVNCDSFRPRRNMWKWSLGVKQRVALEGFRPLMHADNTERTFEQIGGRPRHQAVPEVRENKASETLAATDEAQAHVSKSTSISRLGCGCCC